MKRSQSILGFRQKIFYIDNHKLKLYVTLLPAIAEILNSKISVYSDKKKVLDCLEDSDLRARVTLDWGQGQVHVLPMARLNQQVSYILIFYFLYAFIA